jgi:hypothetical protein
MLNPSKIVRQLENERKQTQAKLDQLDTALKVLGGGWNYRLVNHR